MRITVKKMEVVVPGAEQQLLGLQTAKVFERELERIAGASGSYPHSNGGQVNSPGKGGPKNG